MEKKVKLKDKEDIILQLLFLKDILQELVKILLTNWEWCAMMEM